MKYPVSFQYGPGKLHKDDDFYLATRRRESYPK
nr:MAG TPA: phospholipase B [Caudoviricetes sp.]